MVVLWHIYGIGIGRINYNFLFAELLFVSIAFLQVFRLHSELLVQVLSRLSAFGTAISERSDTWFSAINNSPNIILGSGLGSVGHKALGFTKYYVHDGSYFKILAETGIIGFSLFMTMLILTYVRFYSTKKDYRLEISIITILLFQAIGSNVLAFQTLLPVFWFSIGRIWSYKKMDV
jgi:O-antigen ligase